MIKISKDEAWKIYETLPKDLQLAIFSEETANLILNACQKNNLTSQQTSQVAELVGYCLMGVLPLENLTNEIATTTNIEQNNAQQIYNELNRLVFFPVKNSLQEIYNFKTATPTAEKANTIASSLKQEAPPLSAQKNKPIEPDTYRESVE